MSADDTTNLAGYVVNLTRFVATRIIPNPPVVWVDRATGEETAEQWSRRETWRVLRPRYWGLLKRLPCGCSRRLGRMVWYDMDCDKHGLALRDASLPRGEDA